MNEWKVKNLLEKLKGERTPEVSLAAQPKALLAIVNEIEVNNLCFSEEQWNYIDIVRMWDL